MQRPWIKSYGDAIPATINVDAYASVRDTLDAAMQTYGQRSAFHSFRQTLTYADVDAKSRAFAAFLQTRLRVRKGDRIAVMAPNILAFPIATIANVRIGAIQVNVNPLYTPRELEHQLNDSGAETIVIFSGSTSALAEAIGATRVKNVIVANVGDGLNAELPSPPTDPRLQNVVSFADALAQGATMDFAPPALRGDDTLFLQYTGGTTGLSKGAALTHRNLIANTEQFKAMMPEAMRPAEETIVTAVPLYHILALMVNFLTYFSIGADNWLVADPRNMDSFVDILKAVRPTVFIGVNTLYAGLTMHPRIREVDWSRLKLPGSGGAATLRSVSDRWKEITGAFIREGYGLSETSPVLTFNPTYIDEFTGTTGLPVPSTDIKLLDDTDNEVAIGEAGEICAKGPQVMPGYWNKPEANKQAFTADGYFRTGDIGIFDERGFLRIVDRKKDMILVSGFNVYPNEVEAVASACPGVAECACIGVPDEKTGEAVKLFVVKRPDATLTENDIVAFCRKELTGYKVPKHIAFTAALPKSNVGKILRRDLRNVG